MNDVIDDSDWAEVVHFVAYGDLGDIVQCGHCQRVVLDDQVGSYRYLVGVTADRNRHYIKDGKVVERPENPASVEGLTLLGLPTPCVIEIDGAEYPCDEPVAELSFSQPGLYRVLVRAWPYLDKEFVIENPAQA